ncbi:hypothetical protein EHM69_10345 [candidate division KSB1 bacterium]|nr:MAG: hypothetical protein EHM69_10345 [candidate division KSB1 bacterium]
MNRISLICLLCLVLSAVSLAADRLPLTTALDRDEVILMPSEIGAISRLDNEEPDTLVYDDNGSSVYFSTLRNFYCYVKFTPPSDFQLRSIYLALADSVPSALPCTVWVCTPNGTRPGATLAMAVNTDVGEGSWFYDITLDDSVDFAGQQDFIVVIGKVPGWPAGWTPLIDGGTTVNRSYYTNANANRLTGTYNAITRDFRIRAGGSYASFVDLSVDECFNSVSGRGPAFFMEPGDTVQLKAKVTNTGNLPAPTYTLNWVIEDTTGQQYFTTSANGSALAIGASETLIAPTTYRIANAGKYVARCTVTVAGDAVADNNVAHLGMFVNHMPGWYMYDDNESDGQVNWSAGTVLGMSYMPVQHTAKIDSIAVATGSAGT